MEIFGMTINEISSLIVVVGSAFFMIVKFAEFFGKPLNKFQNTKKKKEKEELILLLKEMLPSYFTEHDLETRNKYLNDRMNYLNEIKSEVLKDTKKDLDELKELGVGQIVELAKIQSSLEILTKSSRDVLRQEIIRIYDKNLPTKTLKKHERTYLTIIYNDYKLEDGNGEVEEYYLQMEEWEVIPD